ncbi:MAG: hypothetical protein M1814_004512 [Vezdaea aestivalis]|nr:MAG: hypothetical protein M1814_004512 [Vezdaea aestivalis]
MAEPANTTTSEVHQFGGILTDLDGTIVDSTDAITQHWKRIGSELGVDHEEILKTSHGRRSIDTLALYDASKANWEYVRSIEGTIPALFGSRARLIPGAKTVLASLTSSHAPWAIVTSGTVPLAQGWLSRLALEQPPHLVTAEDVSLGKPDPACYVLGMEKLGLVGGKKPVLVLEDAPSGIKAGKAAGCLVVGLLTTHGEDEVRAAGADWIVNDLEGVVVGGWDSDSGCITVEITPVPLRG